MAGTPGPADRSREVVTDLVEYIVVSVPDLDSLAFVAPALAELVETGQIRVLDLVAVVRDGDRSVSVREVDSVESIAALRDVDGEVGGMLSEHDIALASLAFPPNSAGVVLVAEDRWAEPLATAARRAGGRIIGGERIPPSRVERAVSGRADDTDGRDDTDGSDDTDRPPGGS